MFILVNEPWSPGPDRIHAIWRLTDEIYKVIQFYGDRSGYTGVRDPALQKHHDKKLDSSLSRTKRVVLELALCNSWDYFCTFTISRDKFDRSDLVAWRTSFTQWMRDQRKKGFPLRYLLIPERHEDGSWHAHGLLGGLPESELISFKQMDADGYLSPNGRPLPRKLVDSDYLNWHAYLSKFGHCSLGPIRSHVGAGFYMTKYMTKDNQRLVSEVGLKSYYNSHGLNRAEKHLDFYGRDVFIDSLLVNKYDFCATGMTHVADCVDWTFGFEFINFKDLRPLDLSPVVPELQEVEDYYQFEQSCLWGD